MCCTAGLPPYEQASTSSHQAGGAGGTEAGPL